MNQSGGTSVDVKATLPEPEKCDAPPRWCVGDPLGRGLYRAKRYVGVADSPELAAEIVAALPKDCTRCVKAAQHPGEDPGTTYATRAGTK